MGIDPAPFWANLFLHHFETNFMKQIISSDLNRAYSFHSIGRFIDDLYALNDKKEFLKSFKYIYPRSLELKIEHEGEHATFLALDVTVKDGIFVYKLFDKRDAFTFPIVRMPFLDSNIPSSIFYGAIFSEILRIARCTLKFEDVVPRLQDLFTRMIAQGAHKEYILKQINKGFQRYPDTFLKFGQTPKEFCAFLHFRLILFLFSLV